MPVRSKSDKTHSKAFLERREFKKENLPLAKKIKKTVLIPKYPKFDLEGDINLAKHDIRFVLQQKVGYWPPSEEEKKKRAFLERKNR
jgi:hypothetical protein